MPKQFAPDRRSPVIRAPSDKPIAALRTFCRKLGWPSLRLYQHTIPADVNHRGYPVITWYEAGICDGTRNEFSLQISECPLGQVRTYIVAVYAIRFRICSGLHSMRLADNGECDQTEVQRLDEWIHHRWFDTLTNRRRFRKMHPECAGYSWRRIREERLPYEVTDAENCITTRAPQSRV